MLGRGPQDSTLGSSCSGEARPRSRLAGVQSPQPSPTHGALGGLLQRKQGQMWEWGGAPVCRAGAWLGPGPGASCRVLSLQRRTRGNHSPHRRCPA